MHRRSVGDDSTSAGADGATRPAWRYGVSLSAQGNLTGFPRRSRRLGTLGGRSRAGTVVHGRWLEAADFTLDPTGRITTWSPIAQKHYGYGEDEVLGRHLDVLCGGPQWGTADRVLADALEQGFVDGIMERRHRDGRLLPMQVRLVPFAELRGAVRGCAEFDLPLGQTDPMLGHAEAERLIKMAAHELRAPLSVVLGALALLDLEWQGGVSESTPEMLGLARDELRQMDELLRGMLESWRMHAPEITLQPGPCDLRQIVDAGLRPLVLLRGRVRVTAPDGPLPVYADQTRLRQVLRNLLTNAIKYSPAGTPIELVVEEAGPVYRVSVIDEGAGIDPADAERIFERHVRGRQQPLADPGGMGIGLYVCRSVIEGHGGRIWAEPRIPLGTRVAFELPRRLGMAAT